MATDDNLIDRNNNNNCDLSNTTTVFIEKHNECNNITNNNESSNSCLISANGALIGTLLSPSSLKIHVNQSSSDLNMLNKSNISIINCSNSSDSNNENVPTNSDNVDEIIEVQNIVTSNDEDVGQQQFRANLIAIQSQTDILENDLKLVANSNNINSTSTNVESRPRRGERRERRRDRQSRCLHHNHHHHHAGATNAPITATNAPNTTVCRSMDILPTLLPPPYTTLPGRGSSTTPFVPSLLTTVGLPNNVVDDLHYSFPIPMIRRSPSERSGKGCCFRWFSGSPFRVILCVLALGGITCAIGGICIGTTTIIGSSASHLTTSLIMIGFGIIILTLSGLAWKFSVSTTNFCWNDFDTCSRRSYNRTQRGIYYPEFQHRPPPPSYQASMQEYRLRLLLLDRERPINIIRVPSPPPTYRSHTSTLVRSTINPSEINRPPSYNNTTNVSNQSRSSTVAQPQNRQTENVPEPIEQQQHDHEKEEEKNNDISKRDCKIILESNEKNISNTNNNNNNNNELVTIVTISGYTDNEQGPNEMEVLAHL